MKRLTSVVALCLLLGGCSGDGTAEGYTSGDAGATSSAGAAGSPASAGAGNAASGGNPGAAGADAAAGANAAGASAAGADGAEGGGSNGGSSAGGASNGGSAAGGSAAGGALGQAGATSGAPIDYSIWVLQLPIGPGTSPTTISSKQLLAGYKHDDYFYPAADGGQIFMDPATGTTTSGSQHCRTEMRESIAGGGQAAWTSTGTNSMTVEGKVIKVGGGNSGTVAVGQLFIGTDSIPLCELMYSTSAKGFKLLYEEAKGGGTMIDLKTPIALDTKYKFTLSLTKGVLTVNVNGKEVYNRVPSAGTLAKKFYFKFGNYDQTAKAGAASTTPYTVVEAYSAVVVHK